jgi:hypothetical protein
VITFPNTGNGCAVCGQTGQYICYDGTYATSNSTNFYDPTPFGSLVTQVKLSVTGVYADESFDFQMYFNVNNNTNVALTVDVPPNTNGFSCTADCTSYGAQTTSFPSGIPNWNYGGINFIGWSGYLGYNACFSQLDLTIIYVPSGDAHPQEITIKP